MILRLLESMRVCLHSILEPVGVSLLAQANQLRLAGLVLDVWKWLCGLRFEVAAESGAQALKS